jgi:hypothetical protein
LPLDELSAPARKRYIRGLIIAEALSPGICGVDQLGG